MKVLKFGGTSVGSPAAIEKVVSIVRNAIAKERVEKGKTVGVPVVVVVSAFSGVTDTLIKLGNAAAEGAGEYQTGLRELEKRHLEAVEVLVPPQGRSGVLAEVKVFINELQDILQGVFLLREVSKRTFDLLMSFGERLSAFIIAQSFQARSVECEYLDSRKLILTDSTFGHAKVEMTQTSREIASYFRDHTALQVVTGFIGATIKGETTTLGRGGSDYTAAILGVALKSDEIQVWTDVDGMLTADPRKVKKAFSLSEVTYEEAMELCHFGAKVIYPPTLQPAMDDGIPIRILNTFNPEHRGTCVCAKRQALGFAVTGISSIPVIGLLRLQGSGMVGVAGVSMRLFGALARKGISVILITQASSEHTICLAIDPLRIGEAKEAIDQEFKLEILSKLVDPVLVETSMSIVSVVGENMQNTPGISGTLFSALGRNGINVVAIAQGSSERNISVVVPQTHELKALNALHDAFFLSDTRCINLYLVGTGLIGKTLLSQIGAQLGTIQRDLALDLRLIGVANSRKSLFCDDGMSVECAREELDARGKASSAHEFLQELKRRDLPNSVWIDCTASQKVADLYPEIISSSVALVTPNKKAQSGPYVAFKGLKDLAKKRRIPFLYETSVGAALPVISTLNDLLASGDKIEKIEAVLSGTLSFVFNSLADSGKKFSEIIGEAREKGFTEPDPREDLQGLDVARKLLILAREVGLALELSDIEVTNLVPEKCRATASVDEFMLMLRDYDSEWEARLSEVKARGGKLCYMAILAMSGGVPAVKVSLEEISASHPFYGLAGSDNIISFTSHRYHDRPLVVKGPGAGAEVTAAGVFADILRIAKAALS